MELKLQTGKWHTGEAFFHPSKKKYTFLFFNWIYIEIQGFSQSVSNFKSVLEKGAFKILVLVPRPTESNIK